MLQGGVVVFSIYNPLYLSLLAFQFWLTDKIPLKGRVSIEDSSFYFLCLKIVEISLDYVN